VRVVRVGTRNCAAVFFFNLDEISIRKKKGLSRPAPPSHPFLWLLVRALPCRAPTRCLVRSAWPTSFVPLLPTLHVLTSSRLVRGRGDGGGGAEGTASSYFFLLLMCLCEVSIHFGFSFLEPFGVFQRPFPPPVYYLVVGVIGGSGDGGCDATAGMLAVPMPDLHLVSPLPLIKKSGSPKGSPASPFAVWQ